MKIFGFPVSPFVRKVIVVAKEKGIEAEVIPSNPQQPDDEFLACSPYRKIPAIEDDGFRLADSTAIAVYLDAKYPEPALLPANAEARGKAVWFDEVADTVIMAAGGPMMFNRFLRAKILGEEPDQQAAAASQEAMEGRLDYLEGCLGENGWLSGDYSLGDVALASTFKAFSYADWTVDAAKYPRLSAWYGRVLDRPAWQEAGEVESSILAGLMAA